MNTYRKFKQPFFLIGAISPARRVVNRLSVDENPNVALACLGGVVVGGARKVPVAPLARIRSERHRRLALASGFRLLRSFRLDRLDAPGHAAARGMQAQMAEDLDDHRRIFDGGISRINRTGSEPELPIPRNGWCSALPTL